MPGICTGLIAGKSAPTGTAQAVNAAQYLWEPACRRKGCKAALCQISIRRC